MSDQEEDAPCLVRIYLKSGQTIETVFNYLEWKEKGNEYQSMNWDQDYETLKKYGSALDRNFEALNTIDLDQIAAISTIKEFE